MEPTKQQLHNGDGPSHPSTSGPRMRCDTCGKVIRSTYRHDWVCCDCVDHSTRIFIDGGSDYTRYGMGDKAKWSWPDRDEAV